MDQSSSENLSSQENNQIFSMLGDRKVTLSTAVIQLLFATTTRPFSWKVKVTGVVCFVKDYDRRGFFFEVGVCNTCFIILSNVV